MKINMGEKNDVLLITAGYDHTIRFWNVTTAQCWRTLQHSESQVKKKTKTKTNKGLYRNLRQFPET